MPRTKTRRAPSNVVPFTGKWNGRASPAAYNGMAEARADHDARAIMGAKRDNDDWTARMLLALLETLTSKQRELLEFRLLGPSPIDSESAVQALAIVQLANGDKGHRERVRAALERLAAREAE